jgi:type IV pilus assembly protein PilB
MLSIPSKNFLKNWPTLNGVFNKPFVELIEIENLVKQGTIPKEKTLQLIAHEFNCGAVDLRQWFPDDTWQQDVLSVTNNYHVFPISITDDELIVATSDPLYTNVKDELSIITDKKVTFQFAFKSDLDWAMEQFKTIDGKIIGKDQTEEDNNDSDNRLSSSNEVIDTIISKAVGQNISDIHMEAKEKSSVIRFRRDGLLVQHDEFPLDFHQTLTSQIKVLAKLDIAEKRVPQDGRFKYPHQDRKIDVRVSTLPTYYGEKIVLRILDQQGEMYDLEQLGFNPDFIDEWKRLLHSPHGLVLVTGPTGSGKTTTLYSSLAEIDTNGKNIVTLEDPIEYALPFANQVQINPKVGLTFAKGLRSILRQDPDVILLGEIRDLETAQFAIQASLTGHFVLSTLHTNSPEGAIVRLNDMGIPPYLISASLLGVLSQRLIRKICEKCKETVETPSDFAVAESLLKRPIKTLTKGKGCQHCHHTGYSGRIAFYDYIFITNSIKELIITNGSEEDIRKEVGYEKVYSYLHSLLEGEVTSLEEVIRIIGWGDSIE